jgi:hypothetical protein
MPDIDPKVIDQLTSAVRAADKAFETAGGSSRHWVRDCFLPELERNGLTIAPTTETENASPAGTLKEAFAELQKVAGKYFENVDPDKFVAEMRGGGEIKIVEAARKFKDATLALNAHQSNEHDDCDKCNELWIAYVDAEMALFRLL